MFSRLSETRFPKSRSATTTDVGPGSYLPSKEDDGFAERSFCDTKSMMSEASFMVFDEDCDNVPKTPRTPRSSRQHREGGSVRQAFGRTTRENVTAPPKLKLPLPTADELAILRRDHAKVKEEWNKERAELEAEILRLRDVSKIENQLDSLQKQALSNLVASLVEEQLEEPRQVFILQQELWNRKVRGFQEQTESLEKKVQESSSTKLELEQCRQELDNALTQNSALSHSVAAAEELVHAQQLELSSLREELAASRQELANVVPVINVLKTENQTLQSELENSQLEVDRLQEVATVSQEALERYLQKEAEMKGSSNRKHKVQITPSSKKGAPCRSSADSQCSPEKEPSHSSMSPYSPEASSVTWSPVARSVTHAVIKDAIDTIAHDLDALPGDTAASEIEAHAGSSIRNVLAEFEDVN